MKQTILGAGGAIGNGLARELAGYTDEIRLVSRTPRKVNDGDELFPADLTSRESVFKAIEGSGIVYVTVGFEYKTAVWRELWPSFMRNVLDGCKQYDAKLVFFDNVYAIGKDHVGHITEESPISPTSRKGEVRAEVDRMILKEMERGSVKAIIARSADFFGVDRKTSIVMTMVYDNLAKGKTAQWMCDADKIHSISYTPDLSKGTAMLGNTPDAYGQVWNLPTDPGRITGRGWVNLFAREMNTGNECQVLPNWLIKGLGLFIPIMRELPEMNYQFDRDYYFDSSKFNRMFNYVPTSHEDAVKVTVEKLRSMTQA